MFVSNIRNVPWEGGNARNAGRTRSDGRSATGQSIASRDLAGEAARALGDGLLDGDVRHAASLGSTDAAMAGAVAARWRGSGARFSLMGDVALAKKGTGPFPLRLVNGATAAR